ncbi:MAG: glycosyltransferase 87 family protein [Patescibacteria group bacterium]
MRKLLLIAVALRLLVSGLLFHPDIKTIAFQTSFLKKGIVNIYPYLINNKVSLPLKEEFVYFPLSYLTLGSYQTFVSSFLGNDFSNWLSDAGANSVVNNPNIIKYLIFLKFPLLVCDISIAFLLLNFFKNRKKGEQAFTLWLFNPFTIILIYAFSNIDIYAVLLTVIAFLYIKREKLITASVFLGLAISFKLYPLLFVPFIYLEAKNIKDKILTVLIPISIFIASVIPFWSEAFVKSALVSGLSVRIFSPNFEIGFGESMIIGIFLLSILFCFAWMYEKNIKLLNYFIVLLLVLFSFSHFHISWLLWIAPFLVIVVIKKPITLWPVLLWSMLAISIPLFYTDRSMTISLFRIYTTWYDLLPTPFIVIQKLYDPYNFQSIIHSVMAGMSVLLSFNLLKDEQI